MRTIPFARAVLAVAVMTPAGLGAATPAVAQQAAFADEGQAVAARAEMAEKFGIEELEPGQFRWAAEFPASGPTKIVISLSDQMGYVYRGDELIGVTTVSSGKTDHETPTGVFPILGKERLHRSKTYENAPMPFMQRLNEYGWRCMPGMSRAIPPVMAA